MERQLFYQNQVVGATEMMRLQTVPEAMFDAFAKEVVGKGVISGLNVTHNAGYGVLVGLGALFAGSGRRAVLGANTNLNCAVDKDGVATVPIPQNGGVDQERYLSIFAVNTDAYSELITLPDDSTTYYTVSDQVSLLVVAGAIAATGAGVRPALMADGVLLVDIKLTSSNALANTFYTDRRQAIQTLYGLSVASAEHTHAINQVTGLQTALDGLETLIEQRAGQAHTHTMSEVIGLASAFSGKANAVHSHGIDSITGLQTALDEKTSTAHTHSIQDVDDLQTVLAGKANTGHTHTLPTITCNEGTVNYQLTISGGSLALTRLN